MRIKYVVVFLAGYTYVMGLGNARIDGPLRERSDPGIVPRLIFLTSSTRQVPLSVFSSHRALADNLCAEFERSRGRKSIWTLRRIIWLASLHFRVFSLHVPSVLQCLVEVKNELRRSFRRCSRLLCPQPRIRPLHRVLVLTSTPIGIANQRTSRRTGGHSARAAATDLRRQTNVCLAPASDPKPAPCMLHGNPLLPFS